MQMEPMQSKEREATQGKSMYIIHINSRDKQREATQSK